MAAPEGNQFWKLRSKHGRDKLFASPDLMWDAACEYFQWCIDNPLYESEAKVISGGRGEPGSVEIAELPRMRPFTIQGLCRYLDCNTKYFYDFKDANHVDFSETLTRIMDTIYEQKFTGAASGFLNPNIIARDLGLADKKEVEKVVKKLNFKDAE